MIDNDKISSTQVWMFVVLTMIGIGIFTLPRAVAEAAGTDGWIATILGGLLGLLDFYIMSRLVIKFPEDTMVEVARKVLGKYLALPVVAIFWIYLLLSTAGMLRIFGEVIKMTLLNRTPLEVIVITMIIVTLILVRCGLEVIARFDQAVFYVLFLTSVLGLGFAVIQADFTNILPFMRTPPIKFLSGAYQTIYTYAGFEMILLISPYVKEPKKVFRAGVTAFAIVIPTYVAAVLFSFGFFKLEALKKLMWPTMALIRAIEVPGSFIENLEGIIITQWVLFSYTSIIAYVFGLALIPQRIMKKKEFKYFIPLVLPLTYMLAMLPDNIIEAYDYLNKSILYAGAPALLVIPPLLLVTASIRKLGVKKSG
jgi:spore germination protein